MYKRDEELEEVIERLWTVESSVLKRSHKIKLYDYFDKCDQALEVINLLEKLGPEDIVEFDLSSGGGDEQVLLSMIDAIKSHPNCTFIAKVKEALSAAGDLVLYCDRLIYNKASKMMLHGTASKKSGKTADFKSRYETLKNTDDFFNQHHLGFLTHKEVEKIQNGANLWFVGDDIGYRFKRFKRYKRRYLIKDDQNKTIVV